MRWSKVGQPRGFFVRAVLNSIQGRFARPLLLLLLLETISNFATTKYIVIDGGKEKDMETWFP